jgi:hypothetical protein
MTEIGCGNQNMGGTYFRDALLCYPCDSRMVWVYYVIGTQSMKKLSLFDLYEFKNVY